MEAPAWLLNGEGHFELNPKKRAGSNAFAVRSCWVLQSVTRTSRSPHRLRGVLRYGFAERATVS